MTTTEQLPIGVLGATGQQGGAVIDALLAMDLPVRAIVRNNGSDGAHALTARGVEVLVGDQDRPDSLTGSLTGLSGLFLMSTFAGDAGTEGEVRRAVGVIDAAVAAGVPRLVYSSVGGAKRNSGVPHFESKRRIEEHAVAALPTVIVRPTYFMENFGDMIDNADADEFVLRMPMPGDVPLQMVAVQDIGAVAAAALVDEFALGGPTLEIAGDELTGEQIVERIGAHLERPARFEQVPVASLGDADLEAMFRWFVDTPAYEADLARTREVDPDVRDLPAWLLSRVS